MSDHHSLPQVRNGHSLFAPSSAHMWMACSGSLIANALSKDMAGAAAAEGTVAHEVGEEWLRIGRYPHHLRGLVRRVVEGDQVFDVTIDEEMLGYVEQYVDWCSCLPGEHFIEQRVDFSDLTPIPNQGGTADHIALLPGRLTITDLKYGIGVKVEAENNPQALLYAYGAFREHDWLYDIQSIVIRICQPRLQHFDRWEIGRKQLLEFADYAKERAAAAWVPNAPRTPGDKQCQFCRVKSDCSALAVLTERLTDGVFEDLDAEVVSTEMDWIRKKLDSEFGYAVNPTTAGDLTLPQKITIFKLKKLVCGWFDDIGADLYRRLEAGDAVPGFKLVEGRTQREFANLDGVTTRLESYGLKQDQYFPRVFVSPAQAEKLLVEQGFQRKSVPLMIAEYVNRIPGKPTIVPEDDPRPSLAERSKGAFVNLDEETENGEI